MCSLRTNVPAMTAHERVVTQTMDGHTQGSPLSVTITCLVVWQAVRPNGRGRWTPDARRRRKLNHLSRKCPNYSCNEPSRKPPDPGSRICTETRIVTGTAVKSIFHRPHRLELGPLIIEAPRVSRVRRALKRSRPAEARLVVVRRPRTAIRDEAGGGEAHRRHLSVDATALSLIHI